MVFGLAVMAMQIPESEKIREVIAHVDRRRIEEDLTALVEFGTRNTFCRRAEEVRRWIADRLRALERDGARVEEHPFPVADRRDRTRTTTGRSVFLLLRGEESPREVVIVGGHYDTWNLRDPDPDASAPGANDNGSGTVAVLEAARVLSRRTWRRSIALVCFDAEEHGLVGSSAFAPFLEEMGLEIIAMINCDIVGGQNQRGRVRVFSEGAASRHVARFAELVAERHTGLELLLQPLLDRPGRGGDHIPFARRGHPAIRWIDETETLEHQHTPTDTIERIDFERLAEIARGVAAVAGSLADALPAPRVRREGAGGIAWEAVDGAAGYVAGTIGADGLSFTRVERTDALRHASADAVAAIAGDGTLGLFGAP